MRHLLLASLSFTLAACNCNGSINSGNDDLTGSGNLDFTNPNADGGGDHDLTVGVACGGGNCAVGEVCETGECHRDCGGAVRCGDPGMEACCPMGDVCYLTACTTPGVACSGQPVDGGVCGTTACPDGQYCETSIGHCLPLAQTVMCEYHPPVGVFTPQVKWEWQSSTTLPGYNQVMMTPVVGDLDGDCMPDVVFVTFAGSNYSSDGVVRAVRGDGSKELWTVTDGTLRAIPGGQIALADVDKDGRLEIFTCHASRALMALNSDGTKKWITTSLPCGNYDAPSVADLDHDGVPEVVVGFAVFNALTGAPLNTPPAVATYSGHGAYTTVAELDGNTGNGMEIVGGGVVYHRDGTLYWDKTGGVAAGYPAVADLDGDGKPDVVSVVATTNQVYAYKGDGTLLWGPKDVNNGVATPKGPTGGGPPTIADFDGDKKPDVATAGGYGYLVLNGQTGAVLWQSTMTTDTSSRVTGSSVFDFEGDGPAEAVYNDEHNLRVYDGKTGNVLVKICSTSGTLWENPVIVDVDADDHAEIVVMDNNYAINTCDLDLGGGPSHTGFKVISDMKNRWVRTRRLWNQHTYHVTNINDDGTVPQNELSNWAQPGLNNFRQNVQTKNLLAAPDLVPKGLKATHELCMNNVLILVATVLNQGAAGVPAGVSVTFYYVDMNGQRQVAGTVKTTTDILPGASQTVSVGWAPQGGDAQGPFTILVTVDDDGTSMGVINECDEVNNTSTPVAVGCPSIM